MSTHIPVLLQEVMDQLAGLQAGAHVVDATYGCGGYTESFLQAGFRVSAFDRDPEAAARAAARHGTHPQFTFFDSTFGAMGAASLPCPPDAVVFDIGVSSPQIDDGARGFSFQKDAPLDMRMDTRTGRTAADIVNMAAESEIADILYLYGEEHASRRIARGIVAARPVTTTLQLAAVIEKVMPRRGAKTHPATRSFQALRIAVNDELGELERGLDGALALLPVGGRIIVVTFHSLEDRIVKERLALWSGKSDGVSRYMPAPANTNAPRVRLLTRKPVEASAAEIAANPRARSARLRAAEKIAEVAA